MTTETGTRDTRPLHQQIIDHRRELDELRAAMQARAALKPDTPEYRDALAREDDLLERIHDWAIPSR
jgi:hypothetical protein